MSENGKPDLYLRLQGFDFPRIGIHPKDSKSTPDIIVYLEPSVVETFYSPNPEKLIYIAEKVLGVDPDRFVSMIMKQALDVHTVVIDAPVYRKYDKGEVV